MGSLICAGFAAIHYRSYMADAGQYIRASEMPAGTREMAGRSADFVNRYPNDPRAHLFRAIYFAERNSLSAAEAEVQTAMSLAASDVAGGPVRSVARALLAQLLLARGRTTEAKARRPRCAAPSWVTCDGSWSSRNCAVRKGSS
ncbi:hypothetical protein ACNJX9_16360 [Bradyrhizobium sp. DASA03076]|uniref:hypothetical protein n=1 Tax=Bradyrhizobium sp. BLXBL-03 TaxID=3395916 RepID=UPI003F723974